MSLKIEGEYREILDKVYEATGFDPNGYRERHFTYPDWKDDDVVRSRVNLVEDDKVKQSMFIYRDKYNTRVYVDDIPHRIVLEMPIKEPEKVEVKPESGK